MGPYSQHFIFFVTYKWAKIVGVFVLGKLFQPSVMKQFEENEVFECCLMIGLWACLQVIKK
jgi:hypothetical protein